MWLSACSSSGSWSGSVPTALISSCTTTGSTPPPKRRAGPVIASAISSDRSRGVRYGARFMASGRRRSAPRAEEVGAHRQHHEDPGVGSERAASSRLTKTSDSSARSCRACGSPVPASRCVNSSSNWSTSTSRFRGERCTPLSASALACRWAARAASSRSPNCPPRSSASSSATSSVWASGVGGMSSARSNASPRPSGCSRARASRRIGSLPGRRGDAQRVPAQPSARQLRQQAGPHQAGLARARGADHRQEASRRRISNRRSVCALRPKKISVSHDSKGRSPG